jgi:cbb3-type cytochrome oxidase maturation protein
MLFVFTAVGLVLFLFGIAALVWSIRSGQLDDLDTPARRMLHEDAPPKSLSASPAIPSTDAPLKPTSSERS